MAAPKTNLQVFTTDWNRTVAWAQAQGIKQSDYYPIYQMDSARVLAGENPMSTSERTRAILAAHNPNQVTPVPGDKPNPTNILGNAVSDLRSIFTGLAPNHLIPNIFDTVKNTILHPATVIKPIQNIAEGALSGNVNQMKTGFEQAAGLKGPGSILSWLPGVYVAGEFAQGGLSEVLAHPVTGFIDVAPFAPVGRIIDAAASASRVATIADKLGMTSEQLRDASLPGMTKSWVLSRKLEDIGYLRGKASSLVDAKGNSVTLGTALDRWITGHTGMGKTLSALMKGMLNLNDTGTNYEMALMRPAELALQSLNEVQRKEVDALISRQDPRAKGKTATEIAADDHIDPAVRTAYTALENVRQWVSDTALASGADVAHMRPDGSIGIYHTYGEPSTVTKSAQGLQDAQDALVRAMEPGHKLTQEIASWDAQAVSLSQSFGETVPRAEAAAERLDGRERVVVDETPRKLGRPAKVRAVHIDIKDQVRELFGDSHGLREVDPSEAGLMGRIKMALDAKDFAGLKTYTAIAKRRLDFANFNLREAESEDPALIELRGQVDALHSYATKRMEYEQRFLEHFQKERRGHVVRETADYTVPRSVDYGEGNKRVRPVSETMAYKNIPRGHVRLFRGESPDIPRHPAAASFGAKGENLFFSASYADALHYIKEGSAPRVYAVDVPDEVVRSYLEDTRLASAEQQFAEIKAGQTAGHHPTTRQDFNLPGKRTRPTTERVEGKMRVTKDLRSAFRDYLSARRAYAKAVWDHPTADWIDVVRDKFIEKLIAEEDRAHRFGALSKALRDSGMPDEHIRSLRTDPVKMAQLIELETRNISETPYDDPILTPQERDAIWKSAVDEANNLRAEGHEVAYIPSVSTLDLRDKDPGRYGIHLATTGRAKRSSRGFEKQLAHVAKRHDVVAGIHQAAKEALQIRATIDFADRMLTPHFVYQDEAWSTIKREFGDHLAAWDPKVQSAQDLTEQIMRDNFNMVRFDPAGRFGFTLPKWQAQGIYLPKEIADALPKMLEKGQFPMDGALDKATGIFRFAILGLSPRYTAHVVFGGTFLLALRSSPRLLQAIPEAWRITHDKGVVPRETIARGATQRGIDPVVYQTFHDSPRNVANRAFLHRSASQAARWLSEEHIEVKQGIKLAAAQPIHWLKAVGDLNYRFTNSVADFQRAWAYSDYLLSHGKGLRDPVTGEKLDWTDERVRMAAEHHVRKTLGDLQAMTPLERAWFTKLMPFYGWTKHILEFTGTYPVDHPFRASALTVMAVQDTNSVSSGLPKRLQFLLFLGSPDVAGNVNAFDVRFMDPLRDVANYATIGGWISAMNPIITAPIAMVDPQIVFGGTPLYPNVTYDQFYGIEAAGSQGSPLTALESVVPQVTALDAALGLSAQYRQEAARNPTGFAKTIFNALNIPFAQMQHLNLKQIAAKNEIDRYQVAKQAATNAFDSGDFSAISGLSSVPDPMNPEWNVSPGYLSKLYKQLLEQYPGAPPSETALPPPSPPL